MMTLDHTHDPKTRSWLASANGHADFPLQNLPLCRFAGTGGAPRVGTGIGDQVLDLTGLAGEPGLPGALRDALQPVAGGSLLPLMGAGPAASRALRHALFAALAEDAPAAERAAVDRHLRPMAGTQLLLPCRPSNFGDFYSSIHHAINIGSLVRPDNPLLPNYKWLPVGYHGRTSSILPSGQDFRRPWGQLPGADRKPEMAPCRRLDWEAELGFLVGQPNKLGEPIPLAEAHEHLFGVALLNDWSARDIQFWEYVPLGPFLGKSFATTLGAWVVTREALAPFRCAPPWDAQRAQQLLPHLDGEQERRSGGFAITVEVHLRSERMRAANLPRQLVSRSNYRDAYWTIGQLVTHQASNGANLEPGDLIGSGTLSGPQPESRACLMEMTRGGTEPFALSSGEQRTFIEDGDEVTLVGYCELPGYARIGLGECTARVLPARAA